MAEIVSMVSNLRLRSAGVADVAWLVRLRNDLAAYFLSPSPATVEQTFRLLETSKTYIVESDGKRLGTFALYNMNDTVAEFGRFMVQRQLHGQQIGRAILEIALEQACLLGIKSLQLRVRTDNEVAKSLYIQAGFRIIAALNGTTEMWRRL